VRGDVPTATIGFRSDRTTRCRTRRHLQVRPEPFLHRAPNSSRPYPDHV